MLTFGEVGRAKKAGGTPFPEPIWSYTYNDQPLSEVEVPLANGKKRDRFLELLALVLTLGYDEYNVAIEDRKNGEAGKQETPDFFITLASTRLIGVEVTRLSDPKRTAEWNLIEQLSIDLSEAMATDPTLTQQYADVSLSIQVALRNPSKAASKALLGAMIERLRAKPANQIIPRHYDRVRKGDDEALCEHSFSLMMRERDDKWIEVTPHIHTETANGDDALRARLLEKSTKNYDRKGDALWIAVPVADPWGQYTYSLSDFEGKSFDITPFEKLILADGCTRLIQETQHV